MQNFEVKRGTFDSIFTESINMVKSKNNEISWLASNFEPIETIRSGKTRSMAAKKILCTAASYDIASYNKNMGDVSLRNRKYKMNKIKVAVTFF